MKDIYLSLAKWNASVLIVVEIHIYAYDAMKWYLFLK